MSRQAERERRRRRQRARRRLLLAVFGAVILIAAGAVLIPRLWPGAAPETTAQGTDRTPASAAATPPATPRTAAARMAAQTAAPTPAPTRTIVADPQPVPIVMYHHIAAQQGGDKTMWLSATQLDAQLAWLKENGWEPVTMRHVYDAWTGQATLPKKPVVLSFDDGYIDQVRVAGPILRRYGWPGEIAIIFNQVYKGDYAPDSVITPDRIKELLADGWGLQSHSVSHPDLRTLSAKDLEHEFVYSRKRLQQIFDVPVEFFCYPGGAYNAKVERAAAAAGYLAATTVDYGAATPGDLYALKRIHVWWGESAADFGARLRSAVAKARREG